MKMFYAMESNSNIVTYIEVWHSLDKVSDILRETVGADSVNDVGELVVAVQQELL